MRHEYFLATSSRPLRPICLRFDVCEDPARRDRIVLYEIYRSRDAFDVHVQAAHFKRFDRETAAWVAHKSVQVLTLVASP